MTATAIGERIGAVLSANNGVVRFLGYGVYESDSVPPKDAGWMAEALNEAGATNPKLVLDNGDTVWGCQCWWGPEALVKKRFEGWRFEGVRIADALLEQGEK